MDDIGKVYTPIVIEDTAFPQQGQIEFATTTPSSGGTLRPTEINDQSIPTKRIAVELLGQALNTRSRKILAEFQFTEMGAIQIGKYTQGVSGDLRISPNGITARNSSGLTTFTLDGDSGDAYFSGTIQAGTVIGGAVAVGDGDILIDGDTKRMIFYDDNGIPQIIIGNA